MTLREEQERVQKAVNSALSHVQEDPWLAQRVLANVKGEAPVKRKAPLALILGVILGVALMGTALAAALQTDFFSHVFGNETRENVAAHQETIENGKGGTYDHLFPNREFVALDPAQAERLVGGCALEAPMTVPVGDHTLTILSAVRDENAMVMEMTLERAGGVTALLYDSLSNEAKGASFNEESGLFFMVENAAEMLYVDARNSTETSVRVYDYCVFSQPLPAGGQPVLLVGTAETGPAGDEGRAWQLERFALPLEQAVQTKTFRSAEGDLIALSPLSLRLIGPAGAEANGAVILPDPGDLKEIAVEYADGSVYTVLRREATDNTMYMCGGLGPSGADTAMVLNRLVDPGAVRLIRVNDVAYTPEAQAGTEN